MTATIGTLSEFIAEKETISAYLERVELFFTANGIEEDKQSLVLLWHPYNDTPLAGVPYFPHQQHTAFLSSFLLHRGDIRDTFPVAPPFNFSVFFSAAIDWAISIAFAKNKLNLDNSHLMFKFAN